ncbi:MAG: hypothetical protein IPN96_02300 [Anaerolineales bacterium]|nr:hypothetical protein [Anaerolineales bacterium]
MIDWDFPPQQIKTRSVNKSLSTISLPERFVGRRTEMRQYKNELLNGKIQKLLITGPGGQGKTSLAGKLAFDMEARGYKVLAWSARTENSWREFEYDMQDALDSTRAANFDRAKGRYQEQTAKLAETMFGLLMDEYNGQVLLFLDNLESIQDLSTHAITDETIAVWMHAARATPGLTVLATSRWALPDWDGEQLELYHASYGDFLQMAQALAQRGQLPAAFLAKRENLYHVYNVLGGNSRALEFFAAALKNMKSASEEDLSASLAHSKKNHRPIWQLKPFTRTCPTRAKFTAPARLSPASAGEGL